jgi:hypothetical protein
VDSVVLEDMSSKKNRRKPSKEDKVDKRDKEVEKGLIDKRNNQNRT